jgi:dsRNA-specific ribonuclease
LATSLITGSQRITKVFSTSTSISNNVPGEGVAKSKKQAEQNAAQMYFQVMDELKKYNFS